MRARGGGSRAQVPLPSVARLPVYRRLLRRLAEHRVLTVSSLELAEAAGVNAATLRRDLSHLGSYGTPGTGYDVERLLEMVDRALAIDQDWPIAIVGAGNLGRALARSHGFTSGGFRVAALVDVDPAQVGTFAGGARVCHLDDLAGVVEREQVLLGVVATPASAAADVVLRLVRAGVRSVLNFAPAVVAAPAGVVVRHVDLAAELQVLAFYASRPAPDAPDPVGVLAPAGAPGGVLLVPSGLPAVEA